MRKKVNSVLDDLIRESSQDKQLLSETKLSGLDIPLDLTDRDTAKVDLSEVMIFKGIDELVFKLLKEIKEACFIKLSDTSVEISVEKEICPQIYKLGIHKICFYSPVENFENLPYFHDDVVSHLRYIFNALQSPALNKDFFNYENDNKENTTALLFPFSREVKSDKTGFHYLVENVKTAHFLRITADRIAFSRMNFRHIKHRMVRNIDLIDTYLDLPAVVASLHSTILGQCRNNKLFFNDSGVQLQPLIDHLRTAGYENLKEISFYWTRDKAVDLLLSESDEWFNNIYRLMMIVTDTTVKHLLKKEKILEVDFGKNKAFLSLSRRGHNYQIALSEPVKAQKLDTYLSRMPKLENVALTNMDSLVGSKVLFIHHFTNETLATLGAFEKLGVERVGTLWVKYSGNVPQQYIETILSLPTSVNTFHALQTYRHNDVEAGFCLSDNYSSIKHFEDLQSYLKSTPNDFYKAMQIVGMHLFINSIKEIHNGEKLIVAEDGGYIAPLINQMCLDKLSLGHAFERYHYPQKEFSSETKNLLFSDWIKGKYIGSVEHTRNGYDALMAVEQKYGELAYPACTLAISNYKVNEESIEVAYSCLNAIENIMNGQGFVLSSRKALVLGDLGAIGIQTMRILEHRLGKGNLAGIDLQINKQNRQWEQFSSIAELNDDIKYNTDLFLGLIGKSILNEAFIEDLILNTNCKQLFFASGSTKTLEFTDLLNWVANKQKSSEFRIKGFKTSINSNPIEDSQVMTHLGRRISIRIQKPDKTKEVELYLLGELMPINFQYYGVPRETMDRVMTEFVSLVTVISKNIECNLPNKVLPLDRAIDINGNLL